MARVGPLIMSVVVLIGLAGCGGQQKQPSYQENKKMVLDILKTDDGKKAVRELLKDKEMRGAIMLDDKAVSKTLIQTLTTEQGKKLWQELLKDPDFSEQLAKTMESENEKLLKQMMKDPGYQGMMMDILKAPELQQQYLSLLKTKPFRQQIDKSIAELMATPLFKKELADVIVDTLKKEQEKQK
ncbi:spore germination lipoprotein GerD [Sporolactobacillus laevolacticus]|uniref:Spore germination protein n=1 Tax=Sporolactobacillus laevolacticus DSM 442 TaxID=1395513 RepID=V6J1D4_9BACL|nr:spore germination lipoprotein GerD [Sporolactobacillus laevolacticus]EST10574.1 spore germination protein [Sporolactobacillus laevolacticus DSM 442]MDF2909755.1 spore gernimation protein GerD [Sporolactobacillus laevolacticus]